jgi:hypothetical protein
MDILSFQCDSSSDEEQDSVASCADQLLYNLSTEESEEAECALLRSKSDMIYSVTVCLMILVSLMNQ